MVPSRGSLGIKIAALVFAVSGLFLILHFQLGIDAYNSALKTPMTVNQTASVALSATSSTAALLAATSSPKAAPKNKATIIPESRAEKTSVASSSTASQAAPASDAAQITRILNPYSTPPLSSDQVNSSTRAALVNILCEPHGGGSMRPISGSGVIIDGKGVILTNSHVAQYVLLSESPEINLSCVIRTGSPASPHWVAKVLYMPPVWVNQHVKDISNSHPTGTGEHDYALLLITGSVDQSPLPGAFPYLPFDTREAIGFLGDEVLGAGYPAEFVGGTVAQSGLFAVSSVSTIDQLLTFSAETVDAISLGGVVEAQSGSSGGAVVNGWGRLIGIISTTSDAPTTAQRDLRAVTLSYINRDIAAQSGSSLQTMLSGDISAKESYFETITLPGLVQQYIQVLSH